MPEVLISKVSLAPFDAAFRAALSQRAYAIMAERKAIRTAGAPAPRPSNSQAVIFNGMIFCSGAIGVDPKTSQLVSGGITGRSVCF